MPVDPGKACVFRHFAGVNGSFRKGYAGEIQKPSRRRDGRSRFEGQLPTPQPPPTHHPIAPSTTTDPLPLFHCGPTPPQHPSLMPHTTTTTTTTQNLELLLGSITEVFKN
ncbi:unnamed protein product [Ilex paraguariensis]|uniref:Uncharacterized protein n=1 Tax=Ilex paraguariensis TaxID=185542 RepID=A0ABC8UJU0_9AQUA